MVDYIGTYWGMVKKVWIKSKNYGSFSLLRK